MIAILSLVTPARLMMAITPIGLKAQPKRKLKMNELLNRPIVALMGTLAFFSIAIVLFNPVLPKSGEATGAYLAGVTLLVWGAGWLVAGIKSLFSRMTWAGRSKDATWASAILFIVLSVY